VPTQPPHLVSSLESRISDFPRISPHPAKKRNEPNKETQAAGLPPLYLTPTEVGDTPTVKISKTNPIYTRPTIKKSKRTQFTVPPPPSPRTKNAKRTQFSHTRCPATPYLCETNPIYRTAGVSPASPPPITRNEPNSHPHAAFPTFSSLLSPLSRATARAPNYLKPNIHYPSTTEEDEQECPENGEVLDIARRHLLCLFAAMGVIGGSG
jgi:hypothetical protein